MNLIEQEQLLLSQIFQVKLYEQQPGDYAITLANFASEIGHLGKNISLMTHNAYFDSLLMDRLQIPKTEIVFYLFECMCRCSHLLDKPWNQQPAIQQFIQYTLQTIKNYVYLGTVEFDTFQNQLVIDSEAEKRTDNIERIAMRLLSYFQLHGYNYQIFSIIHPRIEDQQRGNFFLEIFVQVILTRMRFQTIVDSKLNNYMVMLKSLLSLEAFKSKFMNIKNYPFIVANLNQIKGNAIDASSSFGLISRYSLLGTLGVYKQELMANTNLEEKIFLEFDKIKYKKDYDNRLKFYQTTEREYLTHLSDIFKLMLKKDSQKQFFEWLAGLIVGNLRKSKLGSRLDSVQLTDVSHDGLVLNIYMCMVEINLPIVDKSKNKFSSIDPQFFIYNPRMQICKYEPIYSKKDAKKSPTKMEIEKEFGTITIFFFTALELLNVGVIPSLNTFMDIYKQQQRILKQFQKIEKSHPYYSKFEKEVNKIKCKFHQYFLVLFDDVKIKSTIKLIDMVLFLLPKWLNIDYNQMKNGKIPGYFRHPLTSYIPQHLLNNIVQFHKAYYRFKQDYMMMVGEQHLNNIINTTCLLLSEVQVSSNPYICAGFIELIFYFIQNSKNNPLPELLKTNEVALQNMTFGLVKFYIDIAFTGSSHQFYSKYNYRFYVNKIFTTIWKHQPYRTSLKLINQTEQFERFINMVMTDTTYCFDETADKYQKLKEYEMKRQNNSMTRQDTAHEENISAQMAGNLQNSTSNIKLMRNLSSWSPQTFHSQAFLTSAVPLFNNILRTLVDPTSFVANREIVAKYSFEKQFVLSDILTIYVNLSGNNSFINQIIRDQRYYKREYFTTALQKATNDNCVDIDVLEKFEQLINLLTNAKNQDENDDDIFGEIPQNYLCSLMGSLMKQPVLLPTSNHIMDKMYIHKHLLNDERDPFNRKPLKYNEVIEQTALKKEIEEWKKKRLQQLRNANKEEKYGKKAETKKVEQETEQMFKNKLFEQ